MSVLRKKLRRLAKAFRPPPAAVRYDEADLCPDSNALFSSDNATIYPFPSSNEPHFATVKDRARPSGLTSVRFIDDTHFIAADFGGKKCHLAKIDGENVEILASHDTIVDDGTPVETDLIDYKDGNFIVSNFYQGTMSLFRIDAEEIFFVRELRDIVDAENLHGAKLHGVRYIPGYEQLIWATSCDSKKAHHRIVDLETDSIVHVIPVEQQCQDVAFLNGFAVVFARTNHISRGEVKLAPSSHKNIMFATAYVYHMPRDLRRSAPEFISEWKGRGHIDAAMETSDGRIFAANQYLDRVDIFEVSDEGQLHLSGHIGGFSMPHGLDIRGDRLAVTNYGDQTLRVMSLPKAR